MIESPSGRVLLDTGASREVLLHNLDAAEVTPSSLSALVLSHAHRDHTGALAALLERQPDLPLYAHPDIWRERYSRRGGRVRAIGLPEDVVEPLRAAAPRLDVQPQEVLPGIWTSGEISERPERDAGDAHLQVREGDTWAPDPCRDDMSLVLECAHGLVLVCGCCHAGLLNTVRHVEKTFGATPTAVVGGTHLISAGENQLRHTIDALREYGPPALYPNHCTGQAAFAALAAAFGARVAPFPAGTTSEF